MRILAFTKYDRRAASTRQRLAQYEPLLRDAGIYVEHLPLLSDRHVIRIAEGRKPSAAETVMRYMNRLRYLLLRHDYDLLWVHCEMFPYLPGVFERLTALPGKPVVFDYDDAIFHMYDRLRNPAARWLLAGKLEPLLRQAALCCCGNAYLLDYASRYCSKSVLLPTVIDTSVYRPRPPAAAANVPPVIGWIGSPSTWRYVRPLLPLLAKLASEGTASVRVVGAGPEAEEDRFPGLELRQWNEELEVCEIQQMDIGIMPLPDEDWARGKCGYKLIQYMGCALPVVAAPIGVNSDIVQSGVNGYLATSPPEWEAALRALIKDPQLRRRMGAEGRKQTEERYSVQLHGPTLVQLLRAL